MSKGCPIQSRIDKAVTEYKPGDSVYCAPPMKKYKEMAVGRVINCVYSGKGQYILVETYDMKRWPFFIPYGEEDAEVIYKWEK